MRTVVVTGASAGVGRATTQRFARGGARLALIARDGDRLEAAAEEARQLGAAEVAIHPLDVADAAAVEEAAGAIEAALGPVDVWVNNAMVTVFGPAHEIAAADYRRVTEVTYLGYVYGTLAALRRMRARGRGHIVQVGSALAYRSIPLQAPYCAAKHAIAGFTDALRSEQIHDKSGVELSVVHLPAINTPQFEWARNLTGRAAQPVPPIFQPEVAAEAIHHVAEHPTREFWLGRSTYQTIIAQKLAPGLADHLAADQAYESQMRDQPVSADRADNLYQPVPGPYGAHGPFDARAADHSPMLWIDKHRPRLAGGLAAAAIAGLAGLVLGRRR